MLQYLVGPCVLAASVGLVAMLTGKPVRALILTVLGPVVVIGFALLFFFAWAVIFRPNSFLLIASMSVSLAWPVAILYFAIASIGLIVTSMRSAPIPPSEVRLAPWLEERRREHGQ